jgi:hypothetical protein
MEIHSAVNQALESLSRTSVNAASRPRFQAEDSFAATLRAMGAPVLPGAERAAQAPPAVPAEAPGASRDTPAALAVERISTARAAMSAVHAALNAAYAAEAADRVARGSDSLATDAAAKFMGAGALGQADPGRGLAQPFSANPSGPMAIPTVTGAALAANSYSSPQHRSPAQKTKVRAPFRPRAQAPGA